MNKERRCRHRTGAGEYTCCLPHNVQIPEMTWENQFFFGQSECVCVAPIWCLLSLRLVVFESFNLLNLFIPASVEFRTNTHEHIQSRRRRRSPILILWNANKMNKNDKWKSTVCAQKLFSWPSNDEINGHHSPSHEMHWLHHLSNIRHRLPASGNSMLSSLLSLGSTKQSLKCLIPVYPVKYIWTQLFVSVSTLTANENRESASTTLK